MKKLLLIIGIVTSLLITAQSQNIAISDDNSYTADPSAMLDVKSLTKGFLVPRMTTVQRTSIVSPATGLLVFDTNENLFYYYTGSIWTSLSAYQLWTKNANYVYLANTDDNVGIGVNNPDNKLLVKADATTGIDESIFAVLNNNGDTVFAVYQEGVRIWVDDNGGTKANGSRGGFAVGGFSPTKAGFTNEYLRVTPDSVRVYIDDNYVAAKANGSRGGFAVGGFNPTKGLPSEHYLFVQDDSTRVYVADSTEGFGVENIEGAENQRIMKLTTENYLIGHESGINLTTGKYNSFYGYETGKTSTDASENVFVGYKSGFSNTLGLRNNFIGCYAGYSNTTGDYNNATGAYAFFSNTTGDYNTANGYQALYSNIIGCNNTAGGYKAMYSNTFGFYNTAFGYFSLFSNVSGAYNVAFGYRSLYSNTTGSSNTAVGYEAMEGNTTGQYNTAVGYYAFHTSSNLENATAIGYDAQVYVSHNVRIGNSAVTSIGGYADWTNVSDKRFKKDVRETVPGLEFITKLRPVTYYLDMDKIAEFNNTPDSIRLKDSEAIKGSMLQTGFIAQEVESAANELGFEFSGVDKPQNENDHYGLRYAEFTVPLVKAIQEQQTIIDDQNLKIEELESKIDLLLEVIEKNK